MATDVVKVHSFLGLWNWIWNPKPDARDVMKEVREASMQLRATSAKLHERLDEYTKAKDPVVAMLADIYETKQERNIWRGPRG
jgi:hypothetical protein